MVCLLDNAWQQVKFVTQHSPSFFNGLQIQRAIQRLLA